MRNEIKEGDIITITHYVKVKSKTEQFLSSDIKLQVIDLNTGGPINVVGKDLVDKMESADKYEKEEQLTKTELAAKFIKAGRRVFTVVFQKADESIRTLRGRLLRSEPLLGRSYVEDLDLVVGSNRQRLVDHRGILSLIIGNVRYTLKGKK